PGDLLYTTNLDNGFAKVSGTSFSAPHVSALIALLISTGSFSYEEIHQNLNRSSVDLGDLGRDDYYGYGLINFNNSLLTDLVKVTLVKNNGEDNESLWIDVNSSLPSFNNPVLEHYEFDNWYFDEELLTPIPIDYVFSADSTIYAKFTPILYTVNLIYNNETYDQIIIMSGGYLENLPEVSVEGMRFYGWYYEENFQTKYTLETITENLTLYARLEEFKYIVTFLDQNNAFYQEYLVEPNTSLTSPTGPFKESDDLFDYVFLNWDQNLENITSDLIVKPIFKKILFFEMVNLNPGIDTIYKNDVWIDTGVSLNDDRLSFVNNSNFYSDKIGTYTIEYDIFFEGELVDTRIRLVNVLDKPQEVIITINEGVTTVLKGEDYIETGASSNIGEVVIDSNVDTNITGVYKVTYRVTIEGTVHEKSKFVFIIDSEFNPLTDLEWYVYKGDEDE
ncbi:MAG: InlB B-repeat-containing protein, partial [Acholeplasma sp.]|nr:InlB B-repeat-containing protein [Acholeplasma sp.]